MCEHPAIEREITWNADGLVPAIVQHERTGEVLMMAWMDQEALDLTRSTGLVHFWSRSRRRLWKKGETSDNTLALTGIAADCDRDTLLVRALPAGPACHTNARTCFVDPRDATSTPQGFADLEPLWRTICQRLASADARSYTSRIAAGGPASTGRKTIEEAAELAEAGLHHEAGRADHSRVAEEAADLIYHLLVLLAERGVTAETVIDELASRRPVGSSQ